VAVDAKQLTGGQAEKASDDGEACCEKSSKHSRMIMRTQWRIQRIARNATLSRNSIGRRTPVSSRRRIVRSACLALLLCAVFGAYPIDRHRVWHDGREIDVVDIDGWAVYDGDILIGRTAHVLERSLREGPDGESIGSVLAKSLTLGTSGGRWQRGTSGLF